MKKLVKRIIGLLSLFVLGVFVFDSNTLMAEAEERTPYRLARVEYEYADTAEEVVQLAINKSMVRNVSSVTNEENDDGRVYVKQLVAETTYSDGSLAKEYALSSVDFYEYSQNTRATQRKSLKDTWGKYDIACCITVYFTEHSGTTPSGVVIHNIAFSYTKAGTSAVNVSKVDMYSHGIYDAALAEPIERYATYRYPSANQVYNLNTDDSRVYSSGGMCDFNLGAKVTLSDGTVSGDYDLMFFLSQIENVW